MTTTNSELRQKLIQLYEKGADSILIDWERDDTKPLIEEIEALINKQIIEARIRESKMYLGYAEKNHKVPPELIVDRLKTLENELRTTK